MTEGQLRYQTLMENQRHNLAVEKYNERQARTGERQAGVSEREVAIKETKLPFETRIAEQQVKTEASKWIGSAFQDAKYFTDALSNMFNVVGTIAKLFA